MVYWVYSCIFTLSEYHTSVGFMQNCYSKRRNYMNTPIQEDIKRDKSLLFEKLLSIALESMLKTHIYNEYENCFNI